VDKNEIYHPVQDRKESDANQAVENRVQWLAFVKGWTVRSIKEGILMASDLLLSAAGQFATEPSFTLVFSKCALITSGFR